MGAHWGDIGNATSIKWVCLIGVEVANVTKEPKRFSSSEECQRWLDQHGLLGLPVAGRGKDWIAVQLAKGGTWALVDENTMVLLEDW